MTSVVLPERLEDRSVLMTVCPFILGQPRSTAPRVTETRVPGTELGERLAYFGVRTNLVNYLKRYGVSNTLGASLVGGISGCSYLSPLMGGWLADAHWGRYRTILLSAMIYLLALALLTVGAIVPGLRVEDDQDANTWQWVLLAVSYLLVTLGTGGIKPNASAFGADQFDDDRERDQVEKISFFQWFYFFVNMGALLASTVLVYLQDQGWWGISFAATGAAMLCALLLFFSGRSLYRRLPPSESPLLSFLGIIKEAVRNRVGQRSCTLASSPLEGASKSQPSKKHWLDWALNSEHVTQQQVTDAKLVFRIFPILLTAVFFWCAIAGSGNGRRIIVGQTDALRILQGTQMDRRLPIFGTATLLRAIPFYNRTVLPCLQKYFNYTPTVLQRVGAGYLMAIASALACFFVERQRMQHYHRDQYHILEDDTDRTEVVDLSIFWLVIPEALIGLAEAGAAIGLLEFFYSQAPDSMRSTMSALNLLTMSLAGYTTSFFLFALNRITTSHNSPWITDNLNEGRLDQVYLLLSAIMAISFCFFFVVARRYEYREAQRIAQPESLQAEVLPKLKSERDVETRNKIKGRAALRRLLSFGAAKAVLECLLPLSMQARVWNCLGAPASDVSPNYNRIWRQSHRASTGGAFFRFMTYNVLADTLATRHRYELYRGTPSEMLKWEHRWRILFAEISQHDPDVLCLQEVDHFDRIKKDLATLGYVGEYLRRTGDCVDGCATFWKTRFKLMEARKIRFSETQVLRDNVALICVLKHPQKLRRRRGTPAKNLVLTVANTHILFNPKRGDIKLAQIRILCDEVARLSRKIDQNCLPSVSILAGDFNSAPDSGIYKFLSEGAVNLAHYSYKNLSGTVDGAFGSNKRVFPAPVHRQDTASQSGGRMQLQRGWWPDHRDWQPEDASSRSRSWAGARPCKTSVVYDLSWAARPAPLNLRQRAYHRLTKQYPYMAGWGPEQIENVMGGTLPTILEWAKTKSIKTPFVLDHDLNLESAYRAVVGTEPEATSLHDRCMNTLDYVFFTPCVYRDQNGQFARLQATAALEMPSLDDRACLMAKPPNDVFGSDHFCVCIDFSCHWVESYAEAGLPLPPASREVQGLYSVPPLRRARRDKKPRIRKEQNRESGPHKHKKANTREKA